MAHKKFSINTNFHLHHSLKNLLGNSLVVQWLLCAFTAKGPGSIPGQGTKIRQATWFGKKKKKKSKRHCTKDSILLGRAVWTALAPRLLLESPLCAHQAAPRLFRSGTILPHFACSRSTLGSCYPPRSTIQDFRLTSFHLNTYSNFDSTQQLPAWMCQHDF